MKYNVYIYDKLGILGTYNNKLLSGKKKRKRNREKNPQQAVNKSTAVAMYHVATVYI